MNTHSVYYDTAYGDWGRIVDAIDRLGVRHVRDGIYANPRPEWRAWNARYQQAILAAAARGLRFDLVAGKPDSTSGTIPQLVEVAATRLHAAVEAVEGPNEYDLGGPSDWPLELRDYQRALYAAVHHDARLTSLPVIGPSLVGEGEGLLGDLSPALDIGNVHPYTGGEAPTPDLLDENLRAEAKLSRRKPVFATEVGFHNAMQAQTGQPPVPEDVAAVYVLRTLLEHFQDGVRRTFLYELVDEKPDPTGRDPEQHFGLLRSDFSPKPAYVALRSMLALLGADRPPHDLTPSRTRVEGDGVRSLVLQRADGAYLLVLWTDESLWDQAARTRIEPTPRTARVTLPTDLAVTLQNPVSGAAFRVDPVRTPLVVHLRADPLVLVLHTTG